MLVHLKTQLQTLLQNALSVAYPDQLNSLPIELDIPTEKVFGEYSSNIALKSAKIFKKAPTVVANEFLAIFTMAIEKSPLKDKIAKIEVKNPGFINFFLTPTALYDVVYQIFKDEANYGRLNFGQNKKIQIEFVSANPTGPLSIAHARQAAVGDALANIFNFIGFKADREFYVNDEGNQINILGRSVAQRAQELLGEKVDFLEDNYQGDYIKDMAKEFMAQHKINNLDGLNATKPETFSQWAADYLLNVIKKELDDFGVHFDTWSHQSKIATAEKIVAVLDVLKGKGFIYEKEGAWWFKSTDFGDDKDRVVKKSDGSYTYLTPDIVYHKDKFDRGYERLINIWGPDHHGYIPRITAVVEALGYKKDNLNVLIVQLATLFRDGKPVSMSTRRGQYVSLREVMTEVGVDAARYFFLMRHISAHLEFDLELAKKATPENPVFYIQYAHARVYSINKKAQEAGIQVQRNKLSLLKEEAELDLIKKMGWFADVLLFCYDQLDPYPLVNYLHELATAFHKFYDQHRVVEENKELSGERLALVNSCRIVLANGLMLLGLTAPESM